MTRLAIIGGGASGLMAASMAARLAFDGLSHGDADPLEITIYEATDKIGRPILRSGNGRCNLTNASIDPSVYHNGSFVEDALAALSDRIFTCLPNGSAFTYEDNPVACYFESLGVVLRQESEGRIYPLANKSSVVLDALKRDLARFGVDVRTGVRIAHVDEPRPDAPLILHAEDGRFIHADVVIDSTGGCASRGFLLPFVGHSDRRPVLGPIAVKSKMMKRLDNIRVRASVALLDSSGAVKTSETGEVMFRKYGVSGIAVFNLSRHLKKGDRLSIDLLPSVSQQDAPDFLVDRAKMLGDSLRCAPTNADMLSGIVLPDVADVLLEYAGLEGRAIYSRSNSDALARALKAFTLECSGIGDESICQVARGGYDVREVDPHTMRLKRYENLFVTGESIDVDAPCGGFNLHWAFSSGMLAAASVVCGIEKGSNRCG